MTDSIVANLRSAFTHCVYASQDMSTNDTRGDTELAGDMAGLIVVRQKLLDLLGTSVKLSRKREELSVKLRDIGPSWPFTQISSYPIGYEYRGRFWSQ